MARAARDGPPISWVIDRRCSCCAMVTIDLAINKAMQIYAMIADDVPILGEPLKARLAAFMHEQTETDEMRLTVLGVTFLRQIPVIT